MKDKLLQMIDFLDDDSVEVRDEIVHQLNEFGYDLEEHIKSNYDLIPTKQLEILMPIILENRRKWIKENWHYCFTSENESEKIESALNLLSQFHYGLNPNPNLATMLNELAEDFKNKFPYGDEMDLAYFLFQEKQITGAKVDYNNPFNSNAIYALKELRGLPITLALVYVMIGYRLGFLIKGCNFPGHFLAKVERDKELIFVDCFNGGKIFFENDIKQITKESEEILDKVINSDSSAEVIIRRVLNNLINSYNILNDTVNSAFFSNLAEMIIIEK